MNLDVSAQYLLTTLHFLTCILLVGGVLMWMQRHDNKKQRTVLAVTLSLSGAMMLLRLVLTYKHGIPAHYPVLPIQNLYGGYWALLLLSFYPVEVVNPGWMKLRTVLLLLSPMILISILMAIIRFEYRPLSSWGEMIQYVDEPNVWFRLIILVILIIPSAVLLLNVPYNWRTSGVDAKWIWRYVVGLQGIGVFYTLFMLTGSLIASSIHLAYCTAFIAYILYQERFLRLLPASTQQPADRRVQQIIDKNRESENTSPLWQKLENHMIQEEPWRSPDLTINDIAKAIGSNRTTLSTEIRNRGYATFYDLVAHYRINALCQLGRQQQIDNLNEAFFAVGFRSRTTAYERFKMQMGMTPTEYIKQIKLASK